MMDDPELVQDMLDAIASIESYAVPSYEAFVRDDKTQDAIMYNLIILGEAANRLTDGLKEKHLEIPWSSIIGARNLIVHGYDQVKLQIVWDIVNKNLQPLKEDLIRLQDSL